MIENPVTLAPSWYTTVPNKDPLYLELEANHPDLLVLLRDFSYLNCFPEGDHADVIAKDLVPDPLPLWC